MNERLKSALLTVRFPARGLFWSLHEHLKDGEPYGTLEMDSEDMAVLVQAKERAVRQALCELEDKKILVQIEPGYYGCPLMKNERKNEALREEIRALVGQWRSKNGAAGMSGSDDVAAR